MPITTKAKLCATLTFETGNVMELYEGDIVKNLVYRKNGTDITVSGAVRVIDIVTKSNNTIPSTCPPEPYAYKYIGIESIVVDSSDVYDAELNRISISSIVSIGDVVKDGGAITVGVGSQYKTLAEVLTTADDNAVIKLTDGEYTDDLTITKAVKLVGTSNTVISGAINVTIPTGSDEPVAVQIEGLKMTGNAQINLTNVNEFDMTNCVFENHNLTDTKSYPVRVESSEPVVMKIVGNTFGDQSNKSYNLFEINAPLATGTEFSNNTFTADSCMHNHINIYDVEEGAVIEINNNVCEMSRNMVRVGIKGEPTCTINMNGNKYLDTDTSMNGDWAGLFFVQAYGTQTTSFANCTINVSNTTMSNVGGQLYYLYAGANDMQFTNDNQPTIIVDGVVQPAKTFA